MLRGKNVLLGVTGSIAAYKSALLVRLLKKLEANVRVIQTKASLDFVTSLTLSTLSEEPVLIEMVVDEKWNNHVDLALWADLMIIAPITAKTMSKMVRGECDSLLIATYLSLKCPVYFAPAMDLDMYQHPSTKSNIDKLIGFGNKLIPANFGELASGLIGEGRMEEPVEIVNFIQKDIISRLPLKGKKILITAGPTYEAIDPVRFIGNYSSGKMGIALANVSAEMGAEVFLVLGPSSINISNNNIKVYNVLKASEMLDKTNELFPNCDIAIFAAAVSDYTPVEIYKDKLKKTHDYLDIKLKKTKDILLEISKKKSKNQFIVGFALETQDELQNAKLKLKDKDLDMIVLNSLNDVGAGFNHSKNKVTLIDKADNIYNFELKEKRKVAEDIIAKIIEKYD